MIHPDGVVIAAKDLRVGDILVHSSPARGDLLAETTRALVRSIRPGPTGTLFIDTSSFTTCRHLEEGVRVVRRGVVFRPKSKETVHDH